MTGKPFSLLNPILDERAARSRRYCIVMSLIALLIGLTKQVPNEILLLGLKFEGANEAIIVWFIFAITAVMLIDFISHAAPNILNFIASYIAHREFLYSGGFIDGESVCNEQYETGFTGMGNNIPTDQYKVGRIYGDHYIANNLFFHKHNSKIIFLCWVRIAIEVAVPLIVCVWALYKLWQLT